MPKKDDYDWEKIINREIRMVLVDFKTQEFISNVFILSANWKPETPTKWLLNATETHSLGKNLIFKTDQF
jgi:hypothetical protein